VCLSLVPTPSASAESWVAGGRARMQRGLQTPVTITPDGAAGLRKAVARSGPRPATLPMWVSPDAHAPAASAAPGLARLQGPGR
jgi:hypothetical protein